MTPLHFFAHMAGLSTVSFLVFLNFLQTPPALRVTSIDAPPVERRVVTVRTPSIGDRTLFGSLPAGLAGVLAVPGDVPRPVQTNRWWSGGIAEPWPAPLFALPLMGTLSPAGLELNAPGRKTALPHAIMHVPADTLRVAIPNATGSHARPVSFGDADVTFRQYAGNKRLFDLTMVEGSPFAFLEIAGTEAAMQLPGGASVQELSCSGSCSQSFLVNAPSRRYLVTIGSNGSFSQQGSDVSVRFPRGGGMLSIGVLPAGGDPAQFLRYALSIPRGIRVIPDVEPDHIATTFRFPSRTVVGLFPHHKKHLSTSLGTSLGSIETVRGPVEFFVADSFETRLPRPPILSTLPVTDSARTAGFRTMLEEEIAIGPRIPGDVYVAGKEAVRLAELAEIADGLSDRSLRERAVENLRNFLTNWCTASPGEAANYFAYDQKLGGLIAIPPAFGSEHYNDHHFHYGYFIRAGAVLTRFDPSFDRDYGTCMRSMIRDIASDDRDDTSYPYLRHFDPYAGHSFAGGLTRFNDGNNQESTSEAMQAWFAIALYGRTIGDDDLEELGTWLLAQEAAATRIYWMRTDPHLGAFPGDFPDPMISILWNGKADYATFFDASPGAIHGIQFFPATTALLPVLDRDVLTRLVDPLSVSTPRSLWETTLSLVSALGGKQVTIPPDVTVDPVYSRVSMEHWVSALRDLGAFEPRYRAEEGCGAVFVKNGIRTLVTYRFPESPETCTIFDTDRGSKSVVRGLLGGWNRKTF